MSMSCTPVPLPLHNNNNSSSSSSNNKSSNNSKNNNKPGRGSHDSGRSGEGCRHQQQCDATFDSAAAPDASRRGSSVSAVSCVSCCVSCEQQPGDVAQWPDRPPTPTIIGHEVMEERARFTVYKVLVRRSVGESWVVFRRYTDFSRLNDKLREMFPGFRLALPPKRWFRDNFEVEFLEERTLGLAAFLQNLVAHQDVANCLPVREFLCLDDSPGPFDSLEESRAFCESLEETNFRLLKELAEAHQETSRLRAELLQSRTSIEALETGIRELKAASPSGHSTVELSPAVTEDKAPLAGSATLSAANAEGASP
ncbi:unnamed protein product [Lampetra fluviatilis]